MKRRGILAALAAISAAFLRGQSTSHELPLGDNGLTFMPTCPETPITAVISFQTQSPSYGDVTSPTTDCVNVWSSALGAIDVYVDGRRFHITAADMARELAPFEA